MKNCCRAAAYRALAEALDAVQEELEQLRYLEELDPVDTAQEQRGLSKAIEHLQRKTAAVRGRP